MRITKLFTVLVLLFIVHPALGSEIAYTFQGTVTIKLANTFGQSIPVGTAVSGQFATALATDGNTGPVTSNKNPLRQNVFRGLE